MPLLAAAVEQYVSSVVRSCELPASGVVSAVLFGSAATGCYSPEISDVDLLIVVADSATAQDRLRVWDTVSELEARAGVTKRHPYQRGALDRLADRITANVRSFFVCTRGDLLSGDPARILNISAMQGRFVDRVAIPSIVGSGVTIWGEDLLPQVPLPPIRRLDVAKAFFSFFNMVLFTVTAYPLVPGATKYAMEALKRSIHNCYYCYRGHPGRLSEEVAFFQQRIGPNATLTQLMQLRRAYQPSLGFILRCLPTLVRLHVATARDNRFPQNPRSSGIPGTSRREGDLKG
ncbi:MAG TPA: nucleotidyltransferase domain-containing protein [Bryobacteraceae bacterium]|jgi:predicted nucleotidyltransferase|nr:nucleotidyltransferase domain-containing protein [Bryobacteraceae bacterium]